MLELGPEVLRYVAMATNFWLFGYVIASSTIFDSTGGFSRSNYPIKTADFKL